MPTVTHAALALALALAAPLAAASNPCAVDHILPNASELSGLTNLDQYGFAISLDGATLAVGIPEWHASGAAAIYERDAGSGSWDLVAAFSPAGLASNARFGHDVHLHDGTLVVGASSDSPDIGGQPSAGHGSAWVFEREPSGTWVQTAKLLGDGTAGVGAALGSGVAVHGDRLAVGAVNANHAYAYERAGGSWSLVQTIPSPDTGLLTPPAGPVDFGAHLDLHEDRLVVADDLFRAGGNAKTGRVYSFAHDGQAWVLGARIDPPYPTIEAIHLGEDLAVHGDVLVIGAPRDDTGAGKIGGRAWAYDLATDGSVTAIARLPGFTAVNGGGFGLGVDAHGTTILVGANGTQLVTQIDRVNGHWTETATAPPPAGLDQFSGNYGFAVTIGADFMAAGCPNITQAPSGYVVIAEPCLP